MKQRLLKKIRLDRKVHESPKLYLLHWRGVVTCIVGNNIWRGFTKLKSSPVHAILLIHDYYKPINALSCWARKIKFPTTIPILSMGYCFGRWQSAPDFDMNPMGSRAVFFLVWKMKGNFYYKLQINPMPVSPFVSMYIMEDSCSATYAFYLQFVASKMFTSPKIGAFKVWEYPEIYRKSFEKVTSNFMFAR